MQTIINNILQDTMYYRNMPVFIYKINYPSFRTTCSKEAGQKINKHYTDAAQAAEAFCRTVLYNQAVDSLRYRQPDAPVQSYTFDIVYEITYNLGCITSLYADTYRFMGGAHGETKRTSDTWDFHTGNAITLDDIRQLSSISLHNLHQSIARQIRERLTLSPGSYFDDYCSLLLDNFEPVNFYLQDNEMVIYYQQYDIAPYSTGIPEFYFPLPSPITLLE